MFVEDSVRCVLHPQHGKGHLCTKVPMTVNSNVIFLVHTNALGDPRDIDNSDMGVGHNNQVDIVNVAVSQDSATVTWVTKASSVKYQSRIIAASSVR